MKSVNLIGRGKGWENAPLDEYSWGITLYQNYKSIHLYGVNATTGTDYIHQKAGIEFWIGMALGRGIKVKVHSDHGTILKAPGWQLYGYDTPQRYS